MVRRTEDEKKYLETRKYFLDFDDKSNASIRRLVHLWIKVKKIFPDILPLSTVLFCALNICLEIPTVKVTSENVAVFYYSRPIDTVPF